MARTSPTTRQTHELPRVVSTLSVHQRYFQSSCKQGTKTRPKGLKSPSLCAVGFLCRFPAHGRHTRLNAQPLNDIFKHPVVAFVAH